MQRMVIWEDNKRKIEDHNQGFLMGRRSFALAMNKYGDLVRSAAMLLNLFLAEILRNTNTKNGTVKVSNLCSHLT